jgi:hypothetical protein
MATVDLVNAAPATAEWWMRRLLARLELRAQSMRRWERYYSGDQPLDFFDSAVRDKFGGRFRHFTSNYVALVVDAFAERLEVTGFRFADPQADDDLWDLWQANDLDGSSSQAHTEALIKGGSFALVEPPQGDGVPRITVEQPQDTIVESDPRDRRKRLAGLKRWLDGAGRLNVYVYLPTEIWGYRSTTAWPIPWEMRFDDTTGQLASDSWPTGGFELIPDIEWPISNRLGQVPLVPILNRPRMHADIGRSEVEPITSNQDLVNYYRAMSVIAARFLAMPQRWALNLDLEVDPKTGQKIQPFKGGVADLWVVEPMAADDPRASLETAQTEFGQFPAADLSGYLASSDAEVMALASIAGFPYYYLVGGGKGQIAPPSGESIKASEARLTKKIRALHISFGEGWEETMRVALVAMGDPRANVRTAETRWAPPEIVNDAARTDSVVKQHAEELIDDELALDVLGYSPQQVRQLKERQAAREKEAAAEEPAPPPQGEPGAGPLQLLPGGPANG